MSRGRQRRVEKNAQRRLESKKKKAQNEIRSTYKALVQNQLFPLLDKFKTVDIKSQSEKLHVWVDALPCSRESSDDVEDDYAEDNNSKKSRKQKSKGAGVTSPAAKKAHPRSSETSEGTTDPEDEPLLCRNFFFQGTCQGMKSGKSKKNGPSCRHSHYAAKHITLAMALKSNDGMSKVCDDKNAHVEVLRLASEAAAISQMNLDDTVGQDPDNVDGIDMLHHIEIPLTSATLVDGASMLGLVSKMLAIEKVPISGIAYVSYSNILLFDRFRGGSVLDEETETKLFEVVVVSDKEKDLSADENLECVNIVTLPGTVLDLILSFLPEKCTGEFPSLCKSFYAEIGNSTPGLWKHLLKRHNWPLLNNTNYVEILDPIAQCKDSFIRHLKTSQKVKSLANSINDVLQFEKDNVGTDDSLVAQFGTDQEDDHYSTSFFWDDSSVLVASQNDCVLRLFNILKQNLKNVCKQVLEVRVAPVPMSRKIRCSLESVATDDRYMICSYIVDKTHKCVLASMLKESLLTNSMEDSILSGEILQCHDVTQRFFEFRDLNVKNQRYHYLDTFIADDEENRRNCNVCIDSDIYACGNGVFLAVASLHQYHDGGGWEFLLRGLMTFSASRGSDFVLDFLRFPMPFIVKEDLMICTNYHRKKRVEPAEIVCRIIQDFSTEIFFATVERRGTFRASCQKELDYGESWLSFSDPNEYVLAHNDSVLSVDGRTASVAAYLLTPFSNRESASKPLAITLECKDFQNAQESHLTTILLQNSYKRILSLIFLENEEYFMVVCAGDQAVDGGESVNNNVLSSEADPNPSIAIKLDLILIHTTSLAIIHHTSIQNSKLYDELNNPIPTLFDIHKTGAMAGVIGNIGLCIIGGTAIDESDEKKIKAKKVKRKKRLGNVGKDRGLLKL